MVTMPLCHNLPATLQNILCHFEDVTIQNKRKMFLKKSLKKKNPKQNICLKLISTSVGEV